MTNVITVQNTLKSIKVAFDFIRCFPHLIYFYSHKNKKVIQADTERWLKIMGHKYKQPYGFIYLISLFPEFRNLFYYRIGFAGYFLNIFCPKMSTLFIGSDYIGEGFFIHHGFATGINAESIGKNCWINQQVSIGSHQGGRPIILDNVIIRPGAVIIGKITIGNNVVIGANATIFCDIPDNCTVYPPSSRIMLWDKKDDNTNTLIEVD
jgi:serine O-acetyltransferase